MKRTIQIFILMMLGTTLLSAAPARGGLHTYRQADGSTFQATLNGDASFHWMESNGEVILYNPQDKNYYNAELNSDGKFVIGNNKVGLRVAQKSTAYTSQNNASKTLNSEKRVALRKLQKESKKGHHPR